MQLSAREYWSRLQPSPEMVVLFLAGDHFLAAALERDPELLEKALARKVLLATPVTLVSVLKGVAYTWRQEKLAQNAVELRRLGSRTLRPRPHLLRLLRRCRAPPRKSGRLVQPLRRVLGIATHALSETHARIGSRRQ